MQNKNAIKRKTLVQRKKYIQEKTKDLEVFFKNCELSKKGMLDKAISKMKYIHNQKKLLKQQEKYAANVERKTLKRRKEIDAKTNELDERFKNVSLKDRKVRLKLMKELETLEKEERKLVRQEKQVQEKQETRIKEDVSKKTKKSSSQLNEREHGFCKRFVNGLQTKHGLSIDEFCKEYQTHSYMNLSHDVKRHNCVCGSPIQHIYVMKHKKTKHRIEIGRVCVTKFLPEEFQKKTCDICNHVHENKKTICIKCENKKQYYMRKRSRVKHISKWTCYTDKYNKIAYSQSARYSYSYVWENDKDYLKWMWLNKNNFAKSDDSSSKIHQWVEEKIYNDYS
tara:strand:+ start:125 stop:1138 length:1014 start_codon:yes stop_codon:yes gene_type:complete